MLINGFTNHWSYRKSAVEDLAILKSYIKNQLLGVPVVVQWLTNPTRNHEVSGSIPGPDQWVKAPALL